MESSVFINEYLSVLTDKLSSEKKDIFLAGDFNFDLLNVASHNETFDFFENMMSHFLLPTITLPTKINKVKSSVIDNIFSTVLHPETISGNLRVSFSTDNHLPSFLIIPRKNKIESRSKMNLFSRNYKNFDRENFLLDLLDINWDSVIDTEKNDVNYSTEQFLNKINSLLDTYAPFKKISKKKLKYQSKPWINDNIIKKITTKNKFLKKLTSLKDPELKSHAQKKYKVHKNELNNLIKSQKKFTMKGISVKTKVISKKFGKA